MHLHLFLHLELTKQTHFDRIDMVNHVILQHQNLQDYQKDKNDNLYEQILQLLHNVLFDNNNSNHLHFH